MWLALLIGAGIVLYLLFWPIEAQPKAWTPPQAPALEGVYATNRRLSAMERLPVGGEGPEDLAFDAQGRMYSGLRDGRIMRMWADGRHLETFANGVALSPDQSYVLVAETNRYRIRRLWLSGPRAGEAEIFVENLPGFPDNISVGQEGLFWVALVSPRKADVDAIYARPFLWRMLLRLPRRLLPEATPYGFVLGIDEQGAIVKNLQDPTGSFNMVTAAVEHDGALYLGSFVEDAIGRLPLD